MSARAGEVVLEARGIVKAFPGVLALDGVSFKVYKGKLNALVGENGAGKSTLIGVLAGLVRPDSGTILYEGRKVSFSDPRRAQEAGVAVIHQELNLIPHLSVAENIFLGREFRTRLGLIDYRRMHREARRLLRRLDLDIDTAVPVSRLRVGRQQIVEIAKALSFHSRVLIMDEPTSALSDHEVEVLFELITNLKEQGVAIAYITHKLDELFRLGDRVTVLRDGKPAGEARIEEVTHDDVVRMMVGRRLSAPISTEGRAPGEEVLRLDNVSLPHPERKGDYLVRDVSLTVRRGEVVGLFGLMGAGRTELLETVFGLHPEAAGRVEVAGRVASVRSPADAIRAGIALAPEDRKTEGLVMSMSVSENMSLSALGKAERGFFLSERLEAGLVDCYIKKLSIKTPGRNVMVENLSGGNQQKVVLAKWLAADPKVLLLDEPTRGIDVKAKREIYSLIDELTAQSLGVLMVSSELPEILALSDRIMVMTEGRKTAEFTRGEATEEKILKAAIPGGRRRHERNDEG